MLQYDDVTKKDIDEMIRLYRKYLNDGEPIIDQITDNYYSGSFVGVKCINDNGKIIGVLSGYKGLDFTCGHDELAADIRTRYPEAMIYTTEMLVVRPEYRHQGVAAGLVNQFNDRISKTDAQYLLVELWREPTGRVPGRVILSELGGEVEHRYIPMFYKNLADYGLTCPICGVECVCGADICLLKLNGRIRSLDDAKYQKSVN